LNSSLADMLVEMNAKASWEHWPAGHLTVPSCFYLAAKVDHPQLGFPCRRAAPSHHLPPSALKPKADSRTASTHQLFLALRGDSDGTARLLAEAGIFPFSLLAREAGRRAGFCHPIRRCSRRGSAGMAAARCCGKRPLLRPGTLRERCAALATAQHHSTSQLKTSA